MRPTLSMAILAALLAGCAVAAERGPGAAESAPGVDAAGDLPPPAARTEPVPAPPPPVTGEVPADLLAKMRADLEQRLATAGITDKPVVVSAEEVVWPDGGMGCGRPGEMYTMMTIPGYRVVFGVGPRRYAYHASRAGAFKYCDRGARLPPPSAGRTTPSM